jgi:NADPH:quinone reductase-like Zn-dependent oxidoreductase
MRAIELQRFGLDGLTQVDRPQPEPGSGEVRVAMRAASINYHDLATILGFANPRLKLPVVPLSDGCGVVDAVGPGVEHWQVGQRITSVFFPRWQSGRPSFHALGCVTGEHLDGCMQDMAILPAQALMSVPDHLTDTQAATLPCAALTAWRALVVEGKIKAGDKVLLLGTGGVSLFALQFAKALGAEVIMTSSSNEKLQQAQKLGADHLVNYRETPAWGKAVRQLTGGEGVDLVVEVGGAGTLGESLNALRIGGHISMIGVLAGVASQVNTAKIMALNATVKGITVGHRQDFADMNRAISHLGIKPVIGEHFGFGQLRNALACMQAGSHIGKIVIDFAH